MRSYEEYHKILTLWERYNNKSLIAELTGIPRGTVRDCIKKFGSLQKLEAQFINDATAFGSNSILLQMLKGEVPPHQDDLLYHYAYVLGMYLGDGCISRVRNVYSLRVTLDAKYPQIIERCAESIQVLLPNNKVNVVNKYVYEDTGRVSCVDVLCYYKFWPEVFPQDGNGPKHKRKIELERWQQVIVEKYPIEFFRGLYHSDGSRSQNIVNGKNYPRYLFTNMSKEIRQMFCDACDQIGVRWTVANKRNICISKRDDVAYLDRIIGPKK